MLHDAQEIVRIGEEKKFILLQGRNPNSDIYINSWRQVRISRNKMHYRALEIKLKLYPPDAGIKWINPWVWLIPTDTTEEENKLAGIDEEFRTLLFETKEAQKELNSNQEAYRAYRILCQENGSAIYKIDIEVHKTLMQLQKTMGKRNSFKFDDRSNGVRPLIVNKIALSETN